MTGGGQAVPEIIMGPLLRERLGCSFEAFAAGLDYETVMVEIGYQDGKSLAEWVGAYPVDTKA